MLWPIKADNKTILNLRKGQVQILSLTSLNNWLKTNLCKITFRNDSSVIEWIILTIDFYENRVFSSITLRQTRTRFVKNHNWRNLTCLELGNAMNLKSTSMWITCQIWRLTIWNTVITIQQLWNFFGQQTQSINFSIKRKPSLAVTFMEAQLWDHFKIYRELRLNLFEFNQISKNKELNDNI